MTRRRPRLREGCRRSSYGFDEGVWQQWRLGSEAHRTRKGMAGDLLKAADDLNSVSGY